MSEAPRSIAEIRAAIAAEVGEQLRAQYAARPELATDVPVIDEPETRRCGPDDAGRPW